MILNTDKAEYISFLYNVPDYTLFDNNLIF